MLTRVGNEPSSETRPSLDLHILRGTLWVLVFVLVAKFVGAGKEIAVAARYGTSAPVDAYLLLFRFYDLPVAVWTGALGITFIPLFFRLRESRAVFDRFRSELIGATIVAGVVLWLIAFVAMPLWLDSAAAGMLPVEVNRIARTMAGPLAFIVPLGLLMAIAFARLIAAERRSVNLLEGVPAAVLLVVLIVFPAGEGGPLVWGTVAGYAAALLALLVTQSRIEPLPRPSLRFQSPLWGDFIRVSLVVGASGFLLSMTTVVDQLMVAHLGTAAIATLGYATRILSLATSIGATAIARVILPVLSDVETTDSARARQIAKRWALVSLAMGIVAVGVGWVLSPIVVRVMFERGAFTPDDTVAVVEVLRFGLLQLPFVFAGGVLAQLWAARRSYAAFLYVNAFVVALKLVANVLLIDTFGINGAMIGTAIMYAACFAVLWWYVPRRN